LALVAISRCEEEAQILPVTEKPFSFAPSDLPKGSNSGTLEQRAAVRSKIFNGYDKNNYPDNLKVQLGISITTIDIVEEYDSIDANIWMRLWWRDSRLAWDSAIGPNVLRASAQEVWRPDITPYNSVDASKMMQCEHTNVLIYSTGDVLWVPPCRVGTVCDFTLDEAPYADQICTMTFGSWTFDGDFQRLDIMNNETRADTKYFQDVGDWTISNTVAERIDKYYDCCVEPYTVIQYNVTLHRRHSHLDQHCKP